MNREFVRAIQTRAGDRCEYCLIPQSAFPLPFQIDHIVAEKHGGKTVDTNLALACTHCNRFKGPNIAGIDPTTGEISRLYNPRQDVWEEHFQFDGAQLTGRTPVGRTTIHVLAMNASALVQLRQELLREPLR